MSFHLESHEPDPLVTEVASEASDPKRVMEIVAQTASELLEVDFVTLSLFDQETWESERLYSTRPEHYPVSGKKPLNQTWWSDWVMTKKKTFVANSKDEIAAVFFDHSEILKLGCESIINIPIVFRGAVIGTINCLAAAQHFTPELVARSERLKLPGALAFLAIGAGGNTHSPAVVRR